MAKSMLVMVNTGSSDTSGYSTVETQFVQFHARTPAGTIFSWLINGAGGVRAARTRLAVR